MPHQRNQSSSLISALIDLHSSIVTYLWNHIQPSQYVVLALLGAWGCMSSSGDSLAYSLPRDNGKPAVSTPELSMLKAFSSGLSALAVESKKALVFISTSKTTKAPQFPEEFRGFEFFFNPRGLAPRKQEGVGSGFFVDLKRGYIITNNHVIDEADTIQIKLHNDKIYDGEVVGRDADTDIAVVQIKDKKFDRSKLSELVLDEGDVKVGELTLAIGAPFSLEASISFGTISATGRANMEVTQLGSFIQTDAAINPGNSGGPLLNMEGQVIGVNTFIFSRSGASAGVGFAIPSSLVRLRAQKLITDGKVERGYIGVQLQNLDENIAMGLGLPEGQKGVLVNDVMDDGPAKKAGVSVGDVIIAVDEQAVKDSSELVLNIGTKDPNSTVVLTVIREGKKRKLRLTIAPWPTKKGEKLAYGDKDPEIDTPSSEYADLGLKVTELTREIQARYNITSSTGFLVTRVEEGKKAFEAGLRRGDVIVSINMKPLDSVDTLKSLLKSKALVMRVEREGSFLFLALKNGKSK